MKVLAFVAGILGCLQVSINGQVADPAPALRFQASSQAEARGWQERAREKLFTLMMGSARPERPPLDPRVLQRIESPGSAIVLEEVTFQALPGRRAHAWVARPARPSGKVGAVLAIHGHGGTGEQVVRGEGLYWYGLALAGLGYVVIAPDVGQHELQHPNWSLMGERTWDAIRCLDYLESLPEVDPERIAVSGLSLGGETAMYVAALDERAKLTCSSGWLTTVANMQNGHCPCFNFKGLQENFDFSDIFACVAPRRLVCELGERERAPGGFPVDIGQRAFEAIRGAYRVFDAETSAILTIHPGGHVFSGRDFWPQLLAVLGAPKTGFQGHSEAEAVWQRAEQNGWLASEGLVRCQRFVEGWLAHADPATGLIPRNLTSSRDFWNGRDSAADNYPYMVLTAAFTDRALMNGRLLDMLRTETRLTSRLGRVPDDYSFSKRGWRRETLDVAEVIFDGAEYVKDGLLPVTEWLGDSPWSERMIGILDDIWKHAGVETPFGMIPTLNFEVNGDLLQACARMYWFTGDRKYLDWGIRIADYYLLGSNHPTRDMKELRLMDHGCEAINGLSEIYVAVSKLLPEKRTAYRAPIHAIFDCILELGSNEDGLLYTSIYPQKRTHSDQLCDTWGYVYDGFYTLYLLDGTEAYRDAVRKALSNLKGKYVGPAWADTSADGFADAIEGAINLYRREPVAPAADWIDSQTRLMWAKQQKDGIIEGWHGDGNIARTTLMYVLWKTQGLRVEPWRPDVRVGAVVEDNALHIELSADQAWTGRVVFDEPRHKTHMRLPLDYPRINQFPEWFTVEREGQYEVRKADGSGAKTVSGQELREGLSQNLDADSNVRLVVKRNP